MSQLSQDDLDEMKMCMGDCQTEVDNEKKVVAKSCANKHSLKKFFFHTISGQLLLVVILYFGAKAIMELFKKD